MPGHHFPHVRRLAPLLDSGTIVHCKDGNGTLMGLLTGGKYFPSGVAYVRLNTDDADDLDKPYHASRVWAGLKPVKP